MNPGWQAFKACLRRECILTDRYQFLYKFRTCQVLIMATITGTVFLKTRQAPTSLLNGQNYMSVCFYSVMVLFFNGQTELTIAVLPPYTHALLEVLSCQCMDEQLPILLPDAGVDRMQPQDGVLHC